MDYRIKLQADVATGRLFVRMAEHNHADDRDSATESKFYLPAGGVPSVEPRPFERTVAKLLGR